MANSPPPLAPCRSTLLLSVKKTTSSVGEAETKVHLYKEEHDKAGVADVLSRCHLMHRWAPA